MNYTDPFVLGDDVLLIPCADLGDDLRGRITFEESDFTLSRRHGRALAQVIDRDTAALLELFREPRTIVDAVVENSRVLGKDPEVLFDELLPHIGTFVHNRVLVPAGAEAEEELRPRLKSGTKFGEYTVVRCLNFVEDREIYQIRGPAGEAALKIARDGTPEVRRMFENEAAILRHLDGSGIAPRLLKKGTRKGRPYLILEWVSGVDGEVAAAERRHDRGALLDLCASVAAAYAALHERGVLHADVHPQNMLVDERVTLLDFGYARFIDRPPRMGRAAMPPFLEPEYLAESRPASAAGEQYALAALLYLLIAGQTYLDFRFEHEAMMRQIETEPPLPFAARGLPPWPEVETILFRALEKDPARRHASVAGMAKLLADVREATPLSAEAHAFLDRTLRDFSRGGEIYEARQPVPGAALGLLRIAEVRGDPVLLALAAVWQSRDRDPVAAAMIAAARGITDDLWSAAARRRFPADALLDRYKQTGDPSCLSEARELANHAASIAQAPDLDLAVLIAELASPDLAQIVIPSVSEGPGRA